MFAGISVSVRDLLHVALAVAICGFILWLDIQTSADITEPYLLPLALIAIYPVKRDWATAVVLVTAIAVVILGALLEEAGDSLKAMVVNRGMTIVVLLGIAFLLNRVTASERELFRVATTDPLTGIFNRRHLLGMQTREQQRAVRYGTTFSVLILDIDHFKRINDTHGHAMGDAAIKAVADAASTHLRPTDMIGRFGGEEFVIVLPHTDEAGAVIAAERIRETVGKVVVPAGELELRFTVSIGAESYVRRTSVDQLLECADKALYAAKAGGRNQVRVGRLADGGGPAAGLAPA